MDEQHIRSHVDSVCVGYSREVHWHYFKALAANPRIRNICILGVFNGRDIAYLATLMKLWGREDFTITGVDKFEDSPGADWPEELRDLSWEAAGFGPAPMIEKARGNLAELGVADHVRLVQDTAQNFLQTTEEKFDFIYIDVSHDYQTTLDTIALALPRLMPHGMLGGDDFSDEGTWGVERAVRESFSTFELHGGWLWLAKPYHHASRPKATDPLPVHFFTIVLNGEPFIRYHLEVFKDLPFKWHWHIIEGLAEHKHDTAWSLANGATIVEAMHDRGRSNDGTSQYLDAIAAAYPENVTVYRKPLGQSWSGKLEMVNAPLANLYEECLLWQVDADELWTAEQIMRARKLFLEQPERTAAWYWCWYFVGERRVVSTRNGYAQNPQQEWLRTWRFLPGAKWAAHEPPTLAILGPTGEAVDLGRLYPFWHAETEQQGLCFQHYSVVSEEQALFKERYYGYKGHVERWKALQSASPLPVRLGDFFHWVGDETQVDSTEACGVLPLARCQGDAWSFDPAWREELDERLAFHPGVPPLELEGVRSTPILLVPDWSRGDWEEVLVSYCQAIPADADVTLVLWLDPAQGVAEQEAIARIEAVLARTGQDPDQTPDMMLLPTALDRYDLARLVAACQGVIPLGDARIAGRAQQVGRKRLSPTSAAEWSLVLNSEPASSVVGAK